MALLVVLPPCSFCCVACGGDCGGGACGDVCACIWQLLSLSCAITEASWRAPNTSLITGTGSCPGASPGPDPGASPCTSASPCPDPVPGALPSPGPGASPGPDACPSTVRVRALFSRVITPDTSRAARFRGFACDSKQANNSGPWL